MIQKLYWFQARDWGRSRKTWWKILMRSEDRIEDKTIHKNNWWAKIHVETPQWNKDLISCCFILSLNKVAKTILPQILELGCNFFFWPSKLMNLDVICWGHSLSMVVCMGWDIIKLDEFVALQVCCGTSLSALKDYQLNY